MSQQPIINNDQEAWLKVLAKGMVTLPKKWRDELGLTNGALVKAKKEGNKVIIEAQPGKLAPYRIYSDAEIDEFLENDELPASLADKVQNKLSVLSNS
jgi:AbrB family looped-hinge helix DNA binding protein